MVNVELAPTDLFVIGGPTSVDVAVDFGEQGQRGSRIWSGAGSPTEVSIGGDVKLYDWFINTSTTSPDFAVMYQYVLEVGNPAWVKQIDLRPKYISDIYSVTFTAGLGTLTIPVSSFTESTTVVIDDFAVQLNLEGTDPIAFGINPRIDGTNLVIDINAASLVASTWTELSGGVDVHAYITYSG